MRIKDKMKLLITAAILALSFNTLASEQTQYNLRVDGITCPFCVATSAKALRKIDGVNKVDANIKEGVISVCADSKTELNDDELGKLFLDKGFKYRGKETITSCEIK